MALAKFDTLMLDTSVYVNVKDYGATGDGSTDDTAKIQALIDSLGSSGKTLYFPPGIYKVTGLVIDNWCKIVGESRISAFIKNVSSTNPCIKITGDAAELTIISDIGIIGDGTASYGTDATSSYGILLDDVVSVNIENCFIRGHGNHCIATANTNVNNINIRGCDIGYCKGDGIHMANASGQINAIDITTSNIAMCNNNGIYIWGNNVNIHDTNTIQGNKEYGILVTNTASSTVFGINIENNYFELDKYGFIKILTSKTPDPDLYLKGLRIVGNFGIMESGQADPSTTSLVTIDYPQSDVVGRLFGMYFDNPGFYSASLNIIDGKNKLGMTNLIRMSSDNNYIGYVNLNCATVIGLKSIVLNGAFCASGVTFNVTTGKSANITTSKDIYFPFNIDSYRALRAFYAYCETDSTNYTVRVDMYYRDKDTGNSYSSVNLWVDGSTTGSKKCGVTMTKAISEIDVDRFFKVSITLTTPGTYFYLHNPSYILAM